MEVRTYRASSMQDALWLVRHDLGPGAAVLHTREPALSRLLGWLPGMRQIEVTASADVLVPSRLAAPPDASAGSAAEDALPATKAAFDNDVASQLAELQSMVEDLCRRTRTSGPRDLPESLFALYTELLDRELDAELARELVERVGAEAPRQELADTNALVARIERLVEREMAVAGPIGAATGRARVVALVGPTGVGKTTTIAKLAANFRLRERRNVGLITVDTYRVAAVEQLRTYADIIDLPMHVVGTPREMREAVDRMAHLDLILMDTAGRSPKDDVKIRELRALLAEARVDEVHLVLSSVASAAGLIGTAERFAPAGATALVFTKLDEATSLANLLPLVRASRLPVSYVTNGQNVPDDIEVADARRLARLIVGADESK